METNTTTAPAATATPAKAAKQPKAETRPSYIGFDKSAGILSVGGVSRNIAKRQTRDKNVGKVLQRQLKPLQGDEPNAAIARARQAALAMAADALAFLGKTDKASGMYDENGVALQVISGQW